MGMAAHCLLALLSWDRRGWLLLREPLTLPRLSQETVCCSQCCVSCSEGTTCFSSIWFVCCEQDNRNLKEQNDELNGQIINLSIQGAKNLFSASFSESLAAEISSVSRDEVRARGNCFPQPHLPGVTGAHQRAAVALSVVQLTPKIHSKAVVS